MEMNKSKCGRRMKKQIEKKGKLFVLDIGDPLKHSSRSILMLTQEQAGFSSAGFSDSKLQDALTMKTPDQ